MIQDIPAQKDLLQRNFFAEDIAKGLYSSVLSNDDGFVIGITGRWGSGKSTLLNFIQTELEKEFGNITPTPCIIKFNPWLFAEAEDIRKAFLKHFLFEIDTITKKRYSQFKKAAKFWEFSKKLGISKIPGGQVGKDLEDLVAKYINRDSAEHYKIKIDEILVKSGQKVFVFIDDIDRLYPKQIFEILQVLKLTGNFKNTYYVVAFDREAVEIGIETQYKDYGKKYLDKIIQADFVIPEVPDEILEQVFFDRLAEIVSTHKINYVPSELSSVWLHNGLRHFFKSLRDIYRFINSINLTLPSIANEVNFIDFIIIETIRLYDYDAYQTIYTNASLSFKTYEQSHSVIDSCVLENRHSQRLLNYLFTDSQPMLSDNAKRLSDPQFFDRYFTLLIQSKDISEKEFRLLMESINKEQVLHNALQHGRLQNLLIRLNDSQILKHYRDWDYTLIHSSYSFLEKNEDACEPYIHAYTDALLNLLSVQEENQTLFYGKFYSNLIQGGNNRLSLTKIYFLHFMILEQDHNTGFSSNAPEFRSYYKRRFEEMKKVYLEYIKKWSSFFGTTPIQNPTSYYTMLFMYDYAGYFPNEYGQAAGFLLQSEVNMIFFIKNIVQINALDGKAFQVKGDYVNRYLPGDLFRQFMMKLKHMDIGLLSSEQKQWREFILNADLKIENHL